MRIKNFRLEKAHKLCSNNKESLLKSANCGCFYCEKIFPAAEVTELVGGHAICPHCGIDSIIGDNATEISKKFLREMHDYWFADAKDED